MGQIVQQLCHVQFQHVPFYAACYTKTGFVKKRGSPIAADGHGEWLSYNHCALTDELERLMSVM